MPQPANAEQSPVDIGALASIDLDDGADQVTDAEMMAVLKESFGAEGPAAKKKSTAAEADDALISSLMGGKAKKPTVPSTAQASSTSPSGATVGARVDARVTEYQRAAVMAKKEGRSEDALRWLRKSKQIVAAIDEVLNSSYPPVDGSNILDAVAAMSSAPSSIP